MVQSEATKHNALHELGYKIFLDRYAQKDMTRSTLAVGDMVIVVVDAKTGQREVGTVMEMTLPVVTIKLLDGDVVERDIEHVDKPLETDPGQMMDRVAAGVAAAETSPELQQQWAERFRWLLEDWKFVPGGRILTAAGTDQELTFYNCYVVPSPRDSRGGIIETLLQMTEIMSRGGGVGINISSLRPKQSYVKGVNGRSSGSVSWGALYSFVTGLIEQGGSRRGALMLILNDWHPDVLDFIQSKRTAGQITNANISVGVSDKMMEAVKADADCFRVRRVSHSTSRPRPLRWRSVCARLTSLICWARRTWKLFTSNASSRRRRPCCSTLTRRRWGSSPRLARRVRKSRPEGWTSSSRSPTD